MKHIGLADSKSASLVSSDNFCGHARLLHNCDTCRNCKIRDDTRFTLYNLVSRRKLLLLLKLIIIISNNYNNYNNNHNTFSISQ